MDSNRERYQQLDKVINRIVAEDPEGRDHCQDAWLSWLNSNAADSRLPPDQALISLIVRRRAVDSIRRRSRQNFLQVDAANLERHIASKPEDNPLELEEIWRSVTRQLNGGDRLLLHLRFRCDCTYRKIARLVGGTPNRARKRIETILKMLQQSPSIRSLRNSE